MVQEINYISISMMNDSINNTFSFKSLEMSFIFQYTNSVI